MLPPGKAVDKRSAEGLETLDTFRCNVFASTVRAMRRSLDATEDQLARASRIGRQRLETIETGGTTTRADMSQV
jgi:DNA-binding XRE family transcriptional regulator